jgi:hypothetical protein
MTVRLELLGIQEKWDRTFQRLDRSCPARRADEGETDYLRRLSRIGRKYIPRSEPIAKVAFDDSLPDNVVEKFSELMRQCVEKNILRTDNMADGELRSYIETDPNTGAKSRCWVGPRPFTDAFTRVKRVARINAPAVNTVWESAFAKARVARLVGVGYGRCPDRVGAVADRGEQPIEAVRQQTDRAQPRE